MHSLSLLKFIASFLFHKKIVHLGTLPILEKDGKSDSFIWFGMRDCYVFLFSIGVCVNCANVNVCVYVQVGLTMCHRCCCCFCCCVDDNDEEELVAAAAAAAAAAAFLRVILA